MAESKYRYNKSVFIMHYFEFLAIKFIKIGFRTKLLYFWLEVKNNK